MEETSIVFMRLTKIYYSLSKNQDSVCIFMILYQMSFRSYFHQCCNILLHNTVAVLAFLDYHVLMMRLVAPWKDERSLDIEIHFKYYYNGGS